MGLLSIYSESRLKREELIVLQSTSTQRKGSDAPRFNLTVKQRLRKLEEKKGSVTNTALCCDCDVPHYLTESVSSALPH